MDKVNTYMVLIQIKLRIPQQVENALNMIDTRMVNSSY